MNTAKKRNWWIYGLVGAILLMIIGVYFKNKGKQVGILVSIEKMKKRSIKEMVFASGKIYPENEVVISSDVSGEIVGLYVHEGDTVKAGQLLAKINPDSYIPSVERGVSGVNSSITQEDVATAQIKNADAQLDQAKSNVATAQQNHTRSKKLYENGVISTADMEAAENTLKSNQANLKAAEAGLNQAKENAKASKFSTQSAKATLQELKTSLNKTLIYAPTSGVISRLNVEKGERVLGTIQMSGTEIMTISNLSSIEVQVEVSENDIVRVSKGNFADIEVDAYFGKKFTGIVTEIANSSATTVTSALNTSEVTNFIVKVRMDFLTYKNMIKNGQVFPFRPGMSASVSINTNTVKDALSAPIQAITTRESFEKSDSLHKRIIEVVFIKSADTAKMVSVTTGIQDDEFIQILTGLKGDEEIITGPYATVSRVLKSGEKIIKKPTSDKKEEESK